ncbi:hypothetical protein ENBRE01_1245 [Enteropsectra breve]|nr:hypothetical protein ENBRE01_1245 [Enteropsectra breve]
MDRKEVEELGALAKVKENETNWLRLNTLLESIRDSIKSSSDLKAIFPSINEILLRSIQSERSRLNGTALSLLKHCVILGYHGYNFSSYMPIIFKLIGKPNKLFMARAQEVLMELGKHIDKKVLVKNINENIKSLNKNVRCAAYKLVILRAEDLGEELEGFLQKGGKDSALEVREVCKNAFFSAAVPSQTQQDQSKKVAYIPSTPRKIAKIELNKEEKCIKNLETEVLKISANISIKETKDDSKAFLEKLALLKKPKENIIAKKDDLTPNKLDAYLNKFRNNDKNKPTPIENTGKLTNISAKALYIEATVQTQSHLYDMMRHITDENVKNDTCERIAEEETIAVIPSASMPAEHGISDDELLSQPEEIDFVSASSNQKGAEEMEDDNAKILIDFKSNETESVGSFPTNESSSLIYNDNAVQEIIQSYAPAADMYNESQDSTMNCSFVHEMLSENILLEHIASDNLYENAANCGVLVSVPGDSLIINEDYHVSEESKYECQASVILGSFCELENIGRGLANISISEIESCGTEDNKDQECTIILNDGANIEKVHLELEDSQSVRKIQNTGENCSSPSLLPTNAQIAASKGSIFVSEGNKASSSADKERMPHTQDSVLKNEKIASHPKNDVVENTIIIEDVCSMQSGEDQIISQQKQEKEIAVILSNYINSEPKSASLACESVAKEEAPTEVAASMELNSISEAQDANAILSTTVSIKTERNKKPLTGLVFDENLFPSEDDANSSCNLRPVFDLNSSAINNTDTTIGRNINTFIEK